MNSFNEKEFLEICQELNARPFIKEVIINYEKSSYFNRIRNAVQKDRRGEVGFCVIRPSGRIIVVTCEDYPEGIFRIPTGGIGYDEDITKAVYREVEEELGLKTEITAFVGVLKYTIAHGSETVPFYSYIFIMKEIGGRLLEDATDDEVSDVREVDINELEKIVESLGSIKGKWKDWGRLRCESSGAVLEYLAKHDFPLNE